MEIISRKETDHFSFCQICIFFVGKLNEVHELRPTPIFFQDIIFLDILSRIRRKVSDKLFTTGRRIFRDLEGNKGGVRMGPCDFGVWGKSNLGEHFGFIVFINTHSERNKKVNKHSKIASQTQMKSIRCRNWDIRASKMSCGDSNHFFKRTFQHNRKTSTGPLMNEKMPVVIGKHNLIVKINQTYSDVLKPLSVKIRMERRSSIFLINKRTKSRRFLIVTFYERKISCFF